MTSTPRSSLAIISLLLLLVVPAAAENAEPSKKDALPAGPVAVSGSVQFNLENRPEGIVVSSGAEAGAKLTVKTDSTALAGAAGQPLGSARRTGLNIELLNPAGGPEYLIVPTPKGYEINSPAGDLVYKVKIKYEEFNIYGSDRLRIAHSAAAAGGFEVMDEEGKVILKISGLQLRQASALAVPLPVSYRILLWAAKP